MLRFDLSACYHLRIFEIRFELSPYVFRDLVLWLATIVNTINSPVFSRFVLVVDIARFQQLFRKIDGRTAWEPTDQALLRLSQRTGMKLVVRARVLHVGFCRWVVDAFPLMASAGALEFESNDPPSCTRCSGQTGARHYT